MPGEERKRERAVLSRPSVSAPAPAALDEARPISPRASEPRPATYGAGARRLPCTFRLDRRLVERARAEVGERDVVRSIEAALAAALDYQTWVRDVENGRSAID